MTKTASGLSLASLKGNAGAHLARAKDLPEVLGFVDLAAAAKALARTRDQKLYAEEWHLRGQRKAGGLLAELGEMRGGSKSRAATLEPLGIDNDESARWQAVAAVPQDTFEAFMEFGCNGAEDITRAGLLRFARNGQGPNGNGPGPLPTDTYRTIVADPPWRYGNTATRGAATDHYATLSVNEISELEVPAAPDAHLYLWTTNAFLRDAFTVVEAWGFEYKTCLTWVKPQIGMGNYFRNSTEHVLFGLRGSLATERNDVPTSFEARRGKHSAKPESFLDLVESCSPGPYLEMFARRRRMGWDVWGNEA